MISLFRIFVFAVAFGLQGLPVSAEVGARSDGGRELPIKLTGSLQNAAWSPDAKRIVFTVFRRGYNRGPSDLAIFDLGTGTVNVILSNGSDNVSQPGSAWSRDNRIIFSSTAPDSDQIFSIDHRGNGLSQLTRGSGKVAYEPSWSPDGSRFVYEAHDKGEKGSGVIMLASADGHSAEPVTSADEDCRQPNWSPVGDEVVYQRKIDRRWGLWLLNTKTRAKRSISRGDENATDASFSPDGRWLLYSLETSETKGANLVAQPIEGGNVIKITNTDRYDGAPSWSPDGSRIVFESYARTSILPEGITDWITERLPFFGPLLLPKSTLWVIDAPKGHGRPGSTSAPRSE
jgi:TolB protein